MEANGNSNSPYKILDVSTNASFADILIKYRKLVKQHHPDNFHQSSEAIKKSAEEKMKKINVAFEQLSVQKSRNASHNNEKDLILYSEEWWYHQRQKSTNEKQRLFIALESQIMAYTHIIFDNWGKSTSPDLRHFIKEATRFSGQCGWDFDDLYLKAFEVKYHLHSMECLFIQSPGKILHCTPPYSIWSECCTHFDNFGYDMSKWRDNDKYIQFLVKALTSYEGRNKDIFMMCLWPRMKARKDFYAKHNFTAERLLEAIDEGILEKNNTALCLELITHIDQKQAIALINDSTLEYRSQVAKSLLNKTTDAEVFMAIAKTGYVKGKKIVEQIEKIPHFAPKQAEAFIDLLHQLFKKSDPLKESTITEAGTKILMKAKTWDCLIELKQVLTVYVSQLVLKIYELPQPSKKQFDLLIEYTPNLSARKDIAKAVLVGTTDAVLFIAIAKTELLKCKRLFKHIEYIKHFTPEQIKEFIDLAELLLIKEKPMKDNSHIINNIVKILTQK